MHTNHRPHITILLLFAPFLLLAQPPSITFKAAGGQGKTISVSRPLDGIYFGPNSTQDTLDKTGMFTIPNNEKVAGAYEFLYKKIYRLYVRPGQSYTLTVDEADTTAPLKIMAADREGQLFLNGLSFDFYQSKGSRLYKADTIFAHNKEQVLAAAAKQLAPFHQLLAQGKIDKGFNSYATRLVNNYQASVLESTLITPMLKMFSWKDSTAYDAAKIKEMDADWQEIITFVNPQDPVNRSVNTYGDYTFVYDQFYLGYFLPLRNGILVKASNDPDEFWTSPYKTIQQFYPEPLKEYLTASWIFFAAMQQEFQPFILDWRRDFVLHYPNSIYYTAMLVASVDKVKDYQEKIRKTSSPAQRFLDHYDTITHFDELAARFKGKTIYMDLWATWCGPCKQEFTYNESLRSFLQSKGIEILYLSVDNQAADGKWKDMIKYYDLQGYHVRASDSLLQDIYKIFGKGPRHTLSIPRYALIKDGEMVLAEAKSPDEGTALYQQLAGFL